MSSRAKKSPAKKAKAPAKAPAKAGKKAAPVKRQSKVLRDNINGITSSAIDHLAKRAGIKRKSGDAVDVEVRNSLRAFLTPIVNAAVTITQYDHRKTLMRKDARAALSAHGINLAVGIADTVKNTDGLKGRRGVAKKAEPGEKKQRRSKPGKAALRNIRKEQKQSGKLNFPKAAFERLIKEYAQDSMEGVRVSEVFSLLIQLAAEDYLVKLLSAANKLAIHADRQTVMLKDIQTVLDISSSVLTH